MNLQEIKKVIDSIGDINAKLPTEDANGRITNLAAFRSLVDFARPIPGIESIASAITQNPAYQAKQSVAAANDATRPIIQQARVLANYITVAKSLVSGMPIPSATESDIHVRFAKADDLPALNDQLATLQKILQQTILDPKIAGKMEVKAVENGSVWIQLCLGSLTAVSLVGSLAWAAAVVLKKYHEARLVEMHVEALEIKNEALDDIRKAQKQMLKGIVEAEARHLEKEAYGDEEVPERLERIKHSITLMQGLIEKGAEVQPALLAPENVKNLFPDFKQLEGVTSRIKQITEKASG